MRRTWTIGIVVVVVGVLFAGPLSARFGMRAVGAGRPAAAPLPPRIPRGLYIKTNISAEIARQSGATHEDLNNYFNNLFQSLVANLAASGLVLQVHWDTLNPNSPDDANAYDWQFLNDAFKQVKAWNDANPDSTPKTIQLVLTPGFQSPKWVLDNLTTCDGLFFDPPKPTDLDCGKATFLPDVEEQDHNLLPMPWNDYYKNQWHNFLAQVNTQYGGRTELVSIAVAGPTASSEEMILPSGDALTQTQFSTPNNPAISPNAMWLLLLANHYRGQLLYQNSDQAFIDEWNNAIDMYGRTFSGITLVATTGSGLPNFYKGKFPIPAPFGPACGHPNMDCAAETTILSHLIQSTVAMNDRKATQTSGLEAARAGHVDLGLRSLELLSSDSTISPAILGGAQFNTSVVKQPEVEGASSVREQALFNVLGVFFANTANGNYYCQDVGTVPLSYLQIYDTDFVYAANHLRGEVTFTVPGCGTFTASIQDELNQASTQLLGIAHQ
jgi:hypothetical protein